MNELQIEIDGEFCWQWSEMGIDFFFTRVVLPLPIGPLIWKLPISSFRTFQVARNLTYSSYPASMAFGFHFSWSTPSRLPDIYHSISLQFWAHLPVSHRVSHSSHDLNQSIQKYNLSTLNRSISMFFSTFSLCFLYYSQIVL